MCHININQDDYLFGLLLTGIKMITKLGTSEYLSSKTRDVHYTEVIYKANEHLIQIETNIFILPRIWMTPLVCLILKGTNVRGVPNQNWFSCEVWAYTIRQLCLNQLSFKFRLVSNQSNLPILFSTQQRCSKFTRWISTTVVNLKAHSITHRYSLTYFISTYIQK